MLGVLAEDVMDNKVWKLVHKEVVKQCDVIGSVQFTLTTYLYGSLLGRC